MLSIKKTVYDCQKTWKSFADFQCSKIYARSRLLNLRKGINQMVLKSWIKYKTWYSLFGTTYFFTATIFLFHRLRSHLTIKWTDNNKCIENVLIVLTPFSSWHHPLVLQTEPFRLMHGLPFYAQLLSHCSSQCEGILSEFRIHSR